MQDQPKSDFGLSLPEILESNKEHAFKRVKPKHMRKELDKEFREGKPMGDSCGIASMDPIFRWRKKGGLYLVSGYEQAGKSAWLKQLAVLRSKIYKTKAAIFSPEEDTNDIIEDLARTYLGRNTNKIFKNQCTPQQWDEAMEWIDEYFTLLEFDGMADFRLLLNEYDELAEVQGVNMFVTDPWNYVAEGSMDQGGTMYLKTALSHMKTFAKRHEAHNCIVEHQNQPRPDNKGNIPRASKFNITGGSMWRNKCDSIMIIHNNWTEATQDNSVDIESAKSKNQRYNGQKGTRTLYFDIVTDRYLDNTDDLQIEIKSNPQTDDDEEPRRLHEGYREEEEDDQPF